MPEPLMQWHEIVGAVLLVAVLVVVHVLEKRHNRKRRLNDPEYLFCLARAMGVSEFDVFLKAAEDWEVSKERVEADFRDYLLQGLMPYYLNDYLRRKRSELGERPDPEGCHRDPMTNPSRYSHKRQEF
jgi:hypothetical protein